MNKAKHRLLTPTELAEQRKALAQAAYAKMQAAQKARAESASSDVPAQATQDPSA